MHIKILGGRLHGLLIAMLPFIMDAAVVENRRLQSEGGKLLEKFQ